MAHPNFFAELKRRNVYKSAVAYTMVAWLLVQAASILRPTFEAPTWMMKAFVALVATGFPIALAALPPQDWLRPGAGRSDQFQSDAAEMSDRSSFLVGTPRCGVRCVSGAAELTRRVADSAARCPYHLPP